MAIDISGLSYFLPIISFLFVFFIMYALIAKTKLLGDNKFVNVLIALVIASIFTTMSSAREYVQTVTPWVVVLIFVVFFIILLVGLSPVKLEEVMGKGFVWFFVVILILVFLISAIIVFSSSSGVWSQVTDFITDEARIAGGIILLIVAALAAWVITRK